MNSEVSLSMPPIPFGSIPGFDNNQIISQDIIGIIGEYVGCLAEQDQPSWNLNRHYEYFRVLFAPRLKPDRRDRIAQWNNELNAEYAVYQNYKKIEDLWKVNKWLLSNNYFNASSPGVLLHIGCERIFYSASTLGQYWFKYQETLGSSSKFRADLSIQSACDLLDQENIGVNGAVSVVFPMQRLRAIIQSMQETIISDTPSCEASAAKIQCCSIFKKALACAVAACLIARRILSQIVPMELCGIFLKSFIKVLLLGGASGILIDGPNIGLTRLAYFISGFVNLYIVSIIVLFHPVFLWFYIRNEGFAFVWEERKDNIKSMIAHIQHIWCSRALITDVYIEGATAHASMAMKSIRRLGPIQGLRHGYRVLSRIARQGLAQA